MAYIIEVELIRNPPPTTFDTSAIKIGRLGDEKGRGMETQYERPEPDWSKGRGIGRRVKYDIRDDLHQACTCRTDSGMIDGGSWEPGKEENESMGVGAIQYNSRLFKNPSDTAATTVCYISS